MNKIIEDLEWRYAVKKFDASKKITPENFEILKASLNLTPTSYGLQPYKVLIIENETIREDLVAASQNQRQVADASHLFVLCSHENIEEQHVNDYMERTASARNLESNQLTGFKNMILSNTQRMSDVERRNWTKRQTYIALGQLLHTCASMRIDATPMEGFNALEYDRILNLSARNLHASLVCPVGYRHAEDPNQFKKKVRKSHAEFFEII